MKASVWRYAPLLVFVMLGAAFAHQLLYKRESLRSALIDRPVPAFSLPSLRDGEDGFSSADLAQGEISVVNLWASWCAPCRAEHPELMRLAALGDVTLYGVNYKDTVAGAGEGFLAELGDPFHKVGVDADGQTALAWGVTGVPETFVVNGEGRIVYKHVGPLFRGFDDARGEERDDLEEILLPVIRLAQEDG